MSGKAEGATRPGVNVQMTRVTDKGGGTTQVTLNTHVPSFKGDAPSVQAVDEMVKRLHDVIQREVVRAADAEERRGALERAQFTKNGSTQVTMPPGLKTPEKLRPPVDDVPGE